MNDANDHLENDDVVEDDFTERRRSWVWIKRLIIAQLVTFPIAVGGFVLAIRADQGRISTLQQSRVESRTDSCGYQKHLAFAAAGPVRHEAVYAYILTTPLRNCTAYAHTDTK